MKTIKEKKARQKEENRKKKNNTEKKLPGYPTYPASEDIFVKGKRIDKKFEDDHQPPTSLSEKEPQPSKTKIDETDLNVDDTIIINIKESDSNQTD